MSREAKWSMVLLIGGALLLAGLQLLQGKPVGAVYVLPVAKTFEVSESTEAGNPTPIAKTWTAYESVATAQRATPGVQLSWPRTIGLWIAALLTLAVLSFLAGDNPAFKLAEAIFVGVSAGYYMVAGFWDQIVPNLLAKLMPLTTMRLGLANLEGSQTVPSLIYLVPLLLSIMMLWQLAPRGNWIASWPLAFFIGATAGVRITATFESDFIRQLQETLLPLLVVVHEAGLQSRIDWFGSVRDSLKNLVIVGGVLTSLCYFFFSIEHRGAVRVASRIGILVLMVTFGAGFAYTVMGRVVLLTQRFEFLFFDWLQFTPSG